MLCGGGGADDDDDDAVGVYCSDDGGEPDGVQSVCHVARLQMYHPTTT